MRFASKFIVKLLTVLTFVALLLGSSIQVVGASHYELDKGCYHPSDAGKLLFVLNNDEAYDYTILRAEMDIAGIGVFEWDMPAFPNGYELKKGQTVNIKIFFKIQVDAQPHECKYTITIERRPGPLITHKGRLSVYAVGEGPPSQPLNPLLLPLIALPILLIAYPLVRWNSRKAAKVIGIIGLALIIPPIVFVPPLFIIFFVVTPIGFLIMILIPVPVLVVHKRGRQGKAQKPTPAPTPFSCSYCRRDLSAFPRNITICPYCGGKLTHRTCPSCSKDLSWLPTDIKNCPYCGKAVSTSIEVKPAPAVEIELPAGNRGLEDTLR